MRRLVKQIDRLIDEPNMMSNTKLLRTSHSELGRLYAKEESYWAQRSRIAWLKEEDKNTQFFHVCTMRSFKKNNIEAINDMDSN